MNKPNLDKLPDYLAFLDQLRADNQIVTKAMLPFFDESFFGIDNGTGMAGVELLAGE